MSMDESREMTADADTNKDFNQTSSARSSSRRRRRQRFPKRAQTPSLPGIISFCLALVPGACSVPNAVLRLLDVAFVCGPLRAIDLYGKFC